MSPEQRKVLERRSAEFDRAGRALRKLLTDIYPVGSVVPVRRNGSRVISAKVVSHAADTPMLHAESSSGRHRVFASDLLAIGEN